jgi:hypothetical protein
MAVSPRILNTLRDDKFSNAVGNDLMPHMKKANFFSDVRFLNEYGKKPWKFSTKRLSRYLRLPIAFGKILSGIDILPPT